MKIYEKPFQEQAISLKDSCVDKEAQMKAEREQREEEAKFGWQEDESIFVRFQNKKNLAATFIVRQLASQSKGQPFVIPQKLKEIANDITELDCSSLPMTLALIDMLAKEFVSITHLKLNGLMELNNSCLQALAKFSHLSNLELAYSSIDDSGVSALAKCSSLESLDLSMTQVEGLTLEELPESLQCLILLEDQIPGEYLEDLEEERPKLTIREIVKRS